MRSEANEASRFAEIEISELPLAPRVPDSTYYKARQAFGHRGRYDMNILKLEFLSQVNGSNITETEIQ